MRDFLLSYDYKKLSQVAVYVERISDERRVTQGRIKLCLMPIGSRDLIAGGSTVYILLLALASADSARSSKLNAMKVLVILCLVGVIGASGVIGPSGPGDFIRPARPFLGNAALYNIPYLNSVKAPNSAHDYLPRHTRPSPSRLGPLERSSAPVGTSSSSPRPVALQLLGIPHWWGKA
ncbi:uncharacterized protein LOC143020500 [Oratosquilla oratoria]|uniref:uncharacterized protein LOC143020500 n=1 Tax=Oratosquilla oratoria TaxID=337810 RepID=UPI003F75FB5F